MYKLGFSCELTESDRSTRSWQPSYDMIGLVGHQNLNNVFVLNHHVLISTNGVNYECTIDDWVRAELDNNLIFRWNDTHAEGIYGTIEYVIRDY